MRPAIFLDRDGVINVDHGHVSRWRSLSSFRTPETLAHLQDAGYLLIISNQSGIGRGFYTESDLEALNFAIPNTDKHGRRERDGVLSLSPSPLGSDRALRIHCDCRKPAPGMIEQAVRDHQIDRHPSLLVGDKESDIQAGRAAGVARLFLFVMVFAQPIKRSFRC